MDSGCRRPGSRHHVISLEKVAEKYLVSKKLSAGTRKEYRSTVTKWLTWGQGVDVDQIGRHHIRDLLDWVHDKATNDGGSNAGRMANKAREIAESVRRVLDRDKK